MSVRACVCVCVCMSECVSVCMYVCGQTHDMMKLAADSHALTWLSGNLTACTLPAR
jgi:hypothetical protein